MNDKCEYQYNWMFSHWVRIKVIYNIENDHNCCLLLFSSLEKGPELFNHTSPTHTFALLLYLQLNEASPLRVSLHMSCTSAQKCHGQNEMMMVLQPLTTSSKQQYSLNCIEELNMTTPSIRNYVLYFKSCKIQKNVLYHVGEVHILQGMLPCRPT